MKEIQTLGQLKSSNYKFRPIKAEMAENLGRILKSGDPVIPGIHGYEDTVMPQLYHAILAGHNIAILGERARPSPGLCET